MTRPSSTLIVGIALIAVGVVGLLATGGSGWPGPGASGWGGHHGPMMRGFGGHPHMFGPWPGPGAGGRGARPLPGARTIEIVATDFAFQPAEIALRAGEAVNLRLVNRGAAVHDLVVPSFGIWLVAPAGRSAVGGFQPAAPGEYEFYCSIPGHREAGMVGRIMVSP